jgi:hypothetical protein
MFSLMLYFLMLVLNRTLLLACISKCWVWLCCWAGVRKAP